MLANANFKQNKAPSSHPNFIQAIIHDGHENVSKNPAEVVWVEVLHHTQESFNGRIMNQPKKLKSVNEGDIMTFINGHRSPYPVMVSHDYLNDKKGWHIRGCNCCGFGELFSNPSEILATVPKQEDSEEPETMFTTLCGMCRSGVQVVIRNNKEVSADAPLIDTPSAGSGQRKLMPNQTPSRWPAWLQAIFQPT